VLIAATCAGCDARPARNASDSSALHDDYGDSIAVGRAPPQRIVSLNPTTTAMLFAMGDGARLVGRTRWDTYPRAVLSVPDVGDGLRPNVEAVLARRPDLVLLYASADDRAAASAFRRAGVATVSLRVDQLSDFARALRLLGLVVGDSAAATRVADSVMATIGRVRALGATGAPVRVVWLVDQAPLRVIGGGSYLSELIADAGGANLYADIAEPSPQVSIEDVLRRNPDAVLASPAIARTIGDDPGWRRWINHAGHRVLVPDTALVGMPSVRMGEAAAQLASLLHPGDGGH
jgi:iron complex transport system substrate-binding protein